MVQKENASESAESGNSVAGRDQGGDWIDEFVACFDVVNASNLQIERAFLLKDKHLPKSLFKFRAVGKFALDNLANDTVWLNSPSQYNDPFDCAAVISPEEIVRARRVELFDMLASRLAHILTNEEIAEARKAKDPYRAISIASFQKDGRIPAEDIPKILDIMDEMAVDNLRGPLQMLVDAVRGGIKMSSFCASHDNVLMWSHYAANHTGFCLEYAVDDVHAVARRALFPVIYSQQMFDATKFVPTGGPEAGAFNNVFGLLQSLYKASEWSYEREWRLVFGAGLIPEERNYPFAKPRRVLLGARMALDAREEVTALCRSRGITVCKVSLDRAGYGLEAENLS